MANIQRKKHRDFLLTSLALGHLANDWVGGTIWLIAPAVAASMGLGPAEVGLLLAVNGIGAGLTYIPAGIAADRFAKQGTLLLITFWWVAVGYFCATLADGFWAVTLLFAFGVMGDAFWHPVATGVLVKQMPQKKAQVLGIHAMGGSIGAEVLGPLTAGLLLGYFDWRTSMQILVIPAVVMGLAFIPIAKRIVITSQRKISKLDLINLLKRWGTRQGFSLIAMMILYNMSFFAILSMTPLYLQAGHGLSPFQSGVVFAAMLLVGTLFQPFTGRLSDRIGRKSVILVIMTLSGAFSVLAAMSAGLISFVVMLLVAATLLTAVRPVVLAAAVEFSAESESTTLGVVFAVLDGVGALGAMLAGFVGELNLSYAYVLAAGLAILATLQTVTIKFHSFSGNAAGVAHTPPAA
ncbi:MAG: MFS transporter [Arenicellales bacterium]|nr:MFS transporter [Arenicellales bacterium]